MRKSTTFVLICLSFSFLSLIHVGQHASAQTDIVSLDVIPPARAFDPSFELVSISFDVNLSLRAEGFVLPTVGPNGGGNLIFSDEVGFEFNGLQLAAPITRSASQAIPAAPGGFVLVAPVVPYDLELNFSFQGELTGNDIDLSQFSQNQGQVFELDVFSLGAEQELTNAGHTFTLANGTSTNIFRVTPEVTSGESDFVVTFNFEPISHPPQFTFSGDSVGDSFGRSVSGAGDVNGDGFDDLIVGAFFDENNGANSGSARVFSGADGSVLYTFNGDSGDSLGLSVSGAGDVNGDGFADLIVGAPFDSDNGSRSGSARVFSGADGSVLYAFNGDSAGEFFGLTVSGAGDVNGDGFADLIAGSRSARVFSGADGSVLQTFDDDDSITSVSGAGDVNGDGFADLIVGAPGNSPSTGRARVFSGADGSVLYTFNGDSAGDRFGNSVSGAGDVNGDGFADLIVGTELDDNNGNFSGSARVFSGADGSVLYIFNGSAGDTFGSSVSGAGDVNGDGFADLIVGALGDSLNRGSARVLSGADGSDLLNFDGDSADDRFGSSVSCAGDVNGDGLADFIVGAEFGGANDGGYARVFVSQTPPTLKGDVDLDGDVDFADIGAFIAVLQSGVFQAEADCDCSTVVDFADIPAFIAILQSQ